MKQDNLKIMRFCILEGINAGYGPNGYVRNIIGIFQNEWSAEEFFENNCTDEYSDFDISPIAVYTTEEEYKNIFKKNNENNKFKLFYGECIIGTKMGWYKEIPQRLGVVLRGSKTKHIFLEELEKEEEQYCSIFDESVGIYVR